MRDLQADCLLHLEADNPLMPLEMRDVHLALNGKPVLRAVDLSLEGAGCSVIMGPNGAGKSVLLKTIHGLMPVDAGQICWGGLPVAQVTRAQAMVFQTPVLLRRSAEANIAFVLKARGKSKRLAQSYLDRVGLSDMARQPARRLSGGQQQRLAIARALATDPQVLLLDEPTASLDPASVLMIEEILRDVRAQGVRIILVTHDIGQARRMADDVVFLNAGQVVEHSPANRFFQRPQNLAAQDYLDGRIIL